MAKHCNSVYGAESDILIPREEWVEPSELEGEEAVLNSTHMKMAHAKMLDLHEADNNVCLLSLCTATRPYSKSFKYKTFIKTFGEFCDLVINSNGGVIPISFEECYPFMTYNARRKNKKFDQLYYHTLCERLFEFLQTFKYDYVVANFNPDQRNYKYAVDVLTYSLEKGLIKGFRFAPSAALRERYKTVGKTYHQKLNPDTHPLILKDITDAIMNPTDGAVF